MTTALTASSLVLDRRREGDGALFTVLGLFAVPEPATGDRRCVTPSSGLPLKALQGALPSDVIEDLDAGRIGFVVGFVHWAADEERAVVVQRANELLRRQISAFAEVYDVGVTEPRCSADSPRGSAVTEGSRAPAALEPETSEPLRLCACGCGTAITGRRDARYAGDACRQRAHRARARIRSAQFLEH